MKGKCDRIESEEFGNRADSEGELLKEEVKRAAFALGGNARVE